MEPSPPKTHRARKFIHRPFYESPKKTSAEIVSEARSTVRSLETKRPFTPADGQRRLFGSGKLRDGRPPSAISIASSYIDSRPPTGRLTPIEQRSDSSADGKVLYSEFADNSGIESFALDLNQNVASSLKKPLFKESILPQPVKSYEPLFSKSKKVSVVHQMQTPHVENKNRRAQSGPKERSCPLEQTEHRSNSCDIINKQQTTISNGSLKEKTLSDKDLIFYEENLNPLLRQMELNHLHEDENSLIVNFDVLWKTLEIGNLFGKSKLGGKRRTDTLATVYKCTTGDNPQLLLKLAKLFFAMEVSGKNLEVACKIMFKVSKDKKHDHLFLEEDIIGSFLKLLECDTIIGLSNCLIYLMGTIKFLSLEHATKKELIKHDILKRISTLLASFKVNMEIKKFKDNCNVLIQVVSALNSFASNSTLLVQFIEHNIINQIIVFTPMFSVDVEYSMSVARLLSKLSMSPLICERLHADSACLEVISDMLKTNYQQQEIVVRCSYVIGNIANFVADSRRVLYVAKDVYIKTLMFYYEAMINEDVNTKDRSTSTPNEDTLIKIIRIFANLSMDADCGKLFSDNQELINALLKLTEKCEELKLSFELVVTISAAINNFSYYMNDTYLISKQSEFTEAFLAVLFFDNMDCVLEVMRVLGNFTQTKCVRDLIISKNVFDVMVTLLDSNSTDLIFATCGVLINMMVDIENRKCLQRFDGITKLIDCLRDLAEVDWLLGSMICQILWNYSEYITTSTEYFGDEQADDLITLLNELNDPALACDYEAESSQLNSDDIEMLKETWQLNFKPVSTLLLQRIETHHSMLEPIIVEPD